MTLWLPAVLGCGVAYHPSPLDLTAVSELVRDYRVTFLLATPTFLQAYLRRCSPEDFGSLQFVVVGAEKLPERLALAFEDRFGIRPLEGYGATECSPVIAVNTRDFRAPGFRQVGAKRGHIGHPLPGISVRIVDPETRERVPVGAAGLAAGARTECDEGLSRQARKNGGSVAGWLVRHGRYCCRRRRRLPHDHRPAEPLQQNRRRDGAAHQDRRKASGTCRRDRAEVRRHRRPGWEERRAARGVAHAIARRTEGSSSIACPKPACQICGRRARINSFTSRSCRISGAASWICAAFTSWQSTCLLPKLRSFF